MKLSENYKNALDFFLHSNILSADTAIENLLRETVENHELCNYIELNGGKINFDKEFSSCFKLKLGYSDNPAITIPFIYALLYSIDMKTFTLDNFLETAYPSVGIDVSYAYFAFSTATALKKLLNNSSIESSKVAISESQTDIIDNDDNDVYSVIDMVKSYLINVAPENLHTLINAEVSGLLTNVMNKNIDNIRSHYYGLYNIARVNKLDETCINYLKEGLQSQNLL